MPKIFTLAVLVFVLVACSSKYVNAQATVFTYQGSLKDAANPANGNYDFEFRLFDAVGSGTQVGFPVQRPNIAVTNGIYTVSVDFGILVFTGAERYLEISIRPTGGGTFTTLSPRQKVAAAPHAIRSLNANDALNLGGVAANQYVVTTDPRMSDARPPTGGSGNYIQNQNVGQQSSSNFNISGNGTVGGTLSGGNVNATTQFNIGGERVLIASGFNTFAGIGAGAVTTGTINAFFGRAAGAANTSGSSNAFFGPFAGQNNTTGASNSFFGRAAGLSNTTGGSNSFFGREAGNNNTTGGNNTFFGAFSGDANTTGVDNTFVGYRAGAANSVGDNFSASNNTFVGSGAGEANISASSNTFVGFEAGKTNTTGATNSYFGFRAGEANNGSHNSFFGYAAGSNTTTGDRNVFIGHTAGQGSSTGYNNTAVGYQAGNMAFNGIANLTTAIGSLSSIQDGVEYATAIGAFSNASLSNSVYLGRPGGEDTVRIPGNLITTGTTTVNGNLVLGSGGVALFASPVTLSILGTTGGSALCRNGSNQIALCSSSLRYKTNIGGFGRGLDLIDRLKPISFDWKDGQPRDLGLGAEDVAAIEPLLVTYNQNGQVEGVKYDRIGVVLVNAVKEQQALIESQQQKIDTLENHVKALRSLVCASNKNATVCK